MSKRSKRVRLWVVVGTFHHFPIFRRRKDAVAAIASFWARLNMRAWWDRAEMRAVPVIVTVPRKAPMGKVVVVRAP